MVKENRWTIVNPPNYEKVERLAKEINVPHTIARILINRGVDTYEKAKIYFKPNISYLNDPFIMNDMEKAVDRIISAIKNKEKILIYGDYDVDGTNGIAMLYLFLKHFDADVCYHVPDRIKEGYGISEYGINLAKDQGVKLLIAIDCGITAIDEVEYAKKFGINVIIADHHEPTSDVPDAVAVLDPLLPGCKYPFKYLSGSGVGFKLIQAISSKLNKVDIAYQFLDFVTLATTADIVPLVDENRTIVKLGLKMINENPRPGIKALINSSGLKNEILNSSQIVFILAPRINAVGRLGDAQRAVQLLISSNQTEADQLASILEEENKARRKIDEETFLHAQELVENYLDLENNLSIVLHQENWHPGVIGIVASRLVEKYYLPTVMMTTVDGVIKGSARSIAGFDIYKALKKVEDKLLQFGGHKYAAGVSVEIDKLEEFKEAFNNAVKELMKDELLKPEIKIDSEIELSEITPRFQKILKEFAPFGPENLRPVFLVKEVKVISPPKIVGDSHLRFKVRQNNITFDAIGFNLGHLKEKVENAVLTQEGLDIVFSINETNWQGSAPAGEMFPQLKVKDLR